MQSQESRLSTIVHVTRSVVPEYPYQVRVLHPELENVGPSKYDLVTQVELWLHDVQKNGDMIPGQRIFDHLREANILADCLGLYDGIEIKKKAVSLFRKIFGGKEIYCWKSVVYHQSSGLSVPCLYAGQDEVKLGWRHLANPWHGNCPAVCFKT